MSHARWSRSSMSSAAWPGLDTVRLATMAGTIVRTDSTPYLAAEERGGGASLSAELAPSSAGTATLSGSGLDLYRDKTTSHVRAEVLALLAAGGPKPRPPPA